ncbi:Pleckstrin homology domain-containing family M member 2 [Trichinella pseudospiralis]|uniref:Pleckstrin homology domain-containing family M member 2 n=1 Tax=Trichinella pseudospiralis TaxID=6337 RepID=A0A0V1JCL6_TRIPS|nr:Pleckstrin homology domain-containing family M member 2 [Trichinella pseudospiralis]KRZ32738.1 Pleckstrin homology domain-containing family M member 2 [Trichinella pseudospiralis]
MFVHPPVKIDIHSLIFDSNNAQLLTEEYLYREKLQKFILDSINEVHKSAACSSSCENHRLSFHDVHVLELIRALNLFLSTGLRNPNETYWPFVRQFIPRYQLIGLSKIKCRTGRVRVWLCSSLADGSLIWQLKSFSSSRKWRQLFYCKGAPILDDRILDGIFNEMQKLEGILFDKTSEMGSLDSTKQSERGNLCIRGRKIDSSNGTNNDSKRDSFRRSDLQKESLSQEISVKDSQWSSENATVNSFEICEDALLYILEGDCCSTLDEVATPLRRTKVKISAPVIEEESQEEENHLRNGEDQFPFCPSPISISSFQEKMNITDESVPSKRSEDADQTQQGSSYRWNSAENADVIDDEMAIQMAFDYLESQCKSDTSSDDYCPATEIASPLVRGDSGQHSPVAELGNNSTPRRSDFERQIWDHLESVSDVLTAYSDSFSGSSCEKNEKANEKNRPNLLNHTGEAMANVKMANLQDGEVMLESGEIVELAVHIFTESDEQFYKMFRVYFDHNKGTSAVRYLVLSNRAVYLVSRVSDTETQQHFLAEFGAPLSNIDYISVGLNSQLTIISALEVTIRRQKSSQDVSPSIVIDANSQKVALTKWMTNELSSTQLSIHHYSLIYWCPRVDNVSSIASTLGRSGYLYVREMAKLRVWQKPAEWVQDYFLLRGQKLYRFEDSSCKVGKRVYNLKEDVSGCREMELDDYEFTFEMLLSETVGSNDHDLVACCALITDNYLFFGQESNNVNFVRTLCIDIVEEGGESVTQMLLSFAVESEMDNFLSQLQAQMPSLNLSSTVQSCVKCEAAAKRWKI